MKLSKEREERESVFVRLGFSGGGKSGVCFSCKNMRRGYMREKAKRESWWNIRGIYSGVYELFYIC